MISEAVQYFQEVVDDVVKLFQLCFVVPADHYKIELFDPASGKQLLHFICFLFFFLLFHPFKGS
jgi:hypothetical protein